MENTPIFKKQLVFIEQINNVVYNKIGYINYVEAEDRVKGVVKKEISFEIEEEFKGKKYLVTIDSVRSYVYHDCSEIVDTTKNVVTPIEKPKRTRKKKADNAA